MVYCVKVYLNREVVEICYFTDLEAASKFANAEENKWYICEIEVYQYHKTVSREFWREAKNENN